MTVMSRFALSTSLLLGVALSGCAYLGGQVEGSGSEAKPAAAAPAAPDTAGAKPAAPPVAKPAAKAAEAAAPAAAPSPGEAALAEGIKAYQSGQFKLAETKLTAALKAGLPEVADQVAAHKHLAFIYCTSKRDTPCAASFKAAKAADPEFALSKAEAGHPMWSRTYKRALGLK